MEVLGRLRPHFFLSVSILAILFFFHSTHPAEKKRKQEEEGFPCLAEVSAGCDVVQGFCVIRRRKESRESRGIFKNFF